MLVYHFLNKKYGLEAIKNRRLKISRINELNDPFEFRGINLKNKSLRPAFRKMKDELNQNRGLHCFSGNWENPVLWSHYANKHRGLCLGFDVPDDLLAQVEYRDKLIEPDILRSNDRKAKQQFSETLIKIKFAHWSYEDEYRMFARLEDQDSQSGFYFSDFSKKLNLAKIIVGAESQITRSDLNNALGNLRDSVEIIKARIAFQNFKVTPQENDKLWK